MWVSPMFGVVKGAWPLLILLYQEHMFTLTENYLVHYITFKITEIKIHLRWHFRNWDRWYTRNKRTEISYYGIIWWIPSTPLSVCFMIPIHGAPIYAVCEAMKWEHTCMSHLHSSNETPKSILNLPWTLPVTDPLVLQPALICNSCSISIP